MANPKVIIISGPNGAGKSTSAPELLQGALAVSELVNADVIARGLSAFDSEKMAVQAGRVMLTRLDELAQKRSSFAFETTLASRSFARWIAGLKKTGYAFHLIFIWLPSAAFAINKAARSAKGASCARRLCGKTASAWVAEFLSPLSTHCRHMANVPES